MPNEPPPLTSTTPGDAPGDMPALSAAERVLRALATARRPSQLADELPISVLDAAPAYSRLQVQLLANRGIAGRQEIERRLNHGRRAEGPPLPNLATAVERIGAAIAAAEPIAVFGDYDTDGMTSCAILTLALRALGARVTPYIPRRDDDGRGLNPEAVAELAEQGTRLLITTDCGSANVAETELARELGMDVIVTDHHPPHGPLPQALAVVNPQLAEPPGTAGDLSGAGVAFRVAEALLTGTEHSTKLDELLDLVAVGTIGDVVPLTAESWALARAGLRRLSAAPRAGLRALLALSGFAADEITERDISFSIAPRLNAAARLGQPLLALDLLLTSDPAEARALGARLDALNQERQRLVDSYMTAARAQADAQIAMDATAPVLITRGKDWHLGVIGLIASKLAEEYARPAFAIQVGDREARGSGRGPEGSHLGEVLREREALLKRFGGHKRAAGFTIATERLDELEAHLRAHAGIHADITASAEGTEGETGATETPILVDCRLALGMIGAERYEEMRALAPFGPAFEEPVFICRNVRITRCWRSGKDGRTLRLRLRDVSDPTSERVALWSRRGEWCEPLQAVLPTLPAFDAIFTLGAYRSRFGSDLEVTPRLLMLLPVGA